MNGPHDVGGMHGFGAVVAEKNEPPFHESWEGRMHGLNLAAGAVGVHEVDEFRHAVEQMPRGEYYSVSYYEKWLFALEKLVTDKGIVTREELASHQPPAEAPRPEGGESELAAGLRHALKGSLPVEPLEAPEPPRFAPGDAVRGRNLHTKQHLRLPGYAKLRLGEVHAHRGAFHHPRDLAHTDQRRPFHLYTVGFRADELWGEQAERPDDVIYIDLFEDYLEPA
jgi:nitrile hydratase beta subunit